MSRFFFGAALSLAASLSLSTTAVAASASYRFETAGMPQASGHGTSIVTLRLVRLPGHKPVKGAIIIQSRADMGPIGMAAMTAPVKALSEKPPGTYRFEIQNGAVWKKQDKWALSVAAKVQGEARTVQGNVVVLLAP